MEGQKKATHVAGFLRYFSEANEMRPTRLGVFERGPVAVTDYWLEDGLPLVGIDVDEHESDSMSVIILLANKEGTEKSHFTHVVKDAKLVKLLLSHDSKGDGLEITDSDGNTTVMRFENRTM